MTSTAPDGGDPISHILDAVMDGLVGAMEATFGSLYSAMLSFGEALKGVQKLDRAKHKSKAKALKLSRRNNAGKGKRYKHGRTTRTRSK